MQLNVDMKQNMVKSHSNISFRT